MRRAAAGTVAAASSGPYTSASQAQDFGSGTAVLMMQAAGIVAAFQLIAYDRDQERQADIDSVEWMQARGMDTTGAPRLWSKLIEEQSAGGAESGFRLLATHPTPRN